MNNEILNKIDEIINYIENTPNYQRYLLIKEHMKDNQEINSLIGEIRVLQKRLVNNKRLDLEDELKKKTNLLNNIPLYREYLNTLDEINNVFNIIENELNKYFSDKVN